MHALACWHFAVAIDLVVEEHLGVAAGRGDRAAGRFVLLSAFRHYFI